MMFVDGENLAIRYGSLLEGQPSKSHVIYEPDVLVWSLYASRVHGPQDFIRRYYYTSAKGDRTTHSAIETRLREVGIEAPHVFRRQKSGKIEASRYHAGHRHAHSRSSQKLRHRILVAGDEDYVPLVEAVKAEGRRVAVCVCR